MAHGRRTDHWRASLDVVEAMRARLSKAEDRWDDPIARQLMAQVALAKASGFIAVLDEEGRVLEVSPAALAAGGVDRSEVVGVPLWGSVWWASTHQDGREELKRSVDDARCGRFVRFDTAVRFGSGGR